MMKALWLVLICLALCVIPDVPVFAQNGARTAEDNKIFAETFAARFSKQQQPSRKAKQKKKHYGVLGNDDRIRPNTEHLKLLGSIGILYNNDSRSVCTAFCISPDTIISAAHCMFSSRLVNKQATGKVDLTKTHFVIPGSFTSSPLAGSDNREVQDSIIAGMKKVPKSTTSFPMDWMILKLQKKACRKSLPLAGLSMAEIRKAASKKRLLMAGFHGDMLDRDLLISPACALGEWSDRKLITRSLRRKVRDFNRILLHKCDAYKGSSGSPMLIRTEGGYQAVAVNVGNIIRYRELRRGRKLVNRKQTGIINVAVRVGAFADMARLMARTRLIVKKDQIKQVQSLLTQAGLKPGPADGVVGRRTRKAIRAFESKNGLQVTGQPSIALYRMLLPENKRALASVQSNGDHRALTTTSSRAGSKESRALAGCETGVANSWRRNDNLFEQDCLKRGEIPASRNNTKSVTSGLNMPVRNSRPPAIDDYVSCRLPYQNKPLMMRRIMCLKEQGAILTSSSSEIIRCFSPVYGLNYVTRERCRVLGGLIQSH